MILKQASDPDSLFNAGLDALNGGREGEAVTLMQRAVQAHPGDPRLWQVLGLAERKLDRLAPAMKALARAAELAPGDALIAHALARATMEAGLPALDLFERARRLAPADGTILLGHAAAQVAQAGPEQAIAGIDALLVQHPGWIDGHALLSRLRYMSGERADFTASIERALAAAPRDLNLWRELIVTLLHAELYERALEAIARGRAAAGANILFDANEAICFAELGDTARADRQFAALGPSDDSTVTIRRVRHLLRSGRPAEAAALGEPLIGGPGEPLVWPYLAVAWRQTGDPRWQWLEDYERFVRIVDLDGLPALDRLAERLRALHNATHQPLDQSVRGGTQTDGPLFSRIEPEIQQLRAAVVAAVEDYARALPPPLPGHPLLGPPRAPIRFAGSWSVRLRAQGHHSNHVHPAGWISSALYVALPSGAERGAAPAGWLSLGQPQAELGLDLEPVRLVEPKPGRLVLFPSTMWHGTVPFQDGERLTVAFDVAIPRLSAGRG